MRPSEKPLVSIVTPVLDRGDTIELALRSVAAQTYANVEHIVVDGLSTDGTVDVLENFGASRPLRWISERDEGMYDAINKGLALARGDILAYLNSDDLYFPWSVEVAVEALKRGADLVYGDAGIMNRAAGRAKGFRIQFYRDYDVASYVSHVVIPQPTVFWSRRVMESIGDFRSDLKYAADHEYWLRAAAAGLRLKHVREMMALQVDHEDTLTSLYPERLGEEMAEIRASYRHAGLKFRSPSLRRVEDAARWRLRQFSFRHQARRSRPRHWPRFMGFLRDLDIEVRGSALRYLLSPGGAPAPQGGWLDTQEFERGLARLQTRG